MRPRRTIIGTTFRSHPLIEAIYGYKAATLTHGIAEGIGTQDCFGSGVEGREDSLVVLGPVWMLLANSGGAVEVSENATFGVQGFSLTSS